MGSPGALVPAVGSGVGWDRDERPVERIVEESGPRASVMARVMSLLAEPAVTAITVGSALKALALPRADVTTAIAALVQNGALIPRGDETGRYYLVSPDRKRQLERLYQDTADELGETRLAVPTRPDAELMSLQDDVPRLPVTAGLLSVFLPGTGQLLNGDIARASLIFAVWSLAFLTHLLPIWTFVVLYAGAEAFFTAKLRSMERELALEGEGGGSPENNGANKPEPRTT